MNSWPGCGTRACLRAADAWLLRGRTVQAMALLVAAQLLVSFVPFHWWRATIGRVAPADQSTQPWVTGKTDDGSWPARRWASHVERAAARLPFEVKCLPRAMALCWLLRIRRIPYTCKIAARPAYARASGDELHAWVEAGDIAVLGKLPGPWLVVANLASNEILSKPG
jgi:hypothetical protein